MAVALLLRDLIVSIAFPDPREQGFPRLAVNKTGKWATALIFIGMGFAAGSVLETPVQEARGPLAGSADCRSGALLDRRLVLRPGDPQADGRSGSCRGAAG